MGVYLLGIEMPTEGTVIVIDSTGQVWSNEWPTRGYTRLDGVTAVSVPPHGRLIDADALMKKVEHDTPLSTVFEKTMRMYLNNAPTIIEAESEGE